MKAYTLGTDGVAREHKKGNWVLKRDAVAKLKALAKEVDEATCELNDLEDALLNWKRSCAESHAETVRQLAEIKDLKGTIVEVGCFLAVSLIVNLAQYFTN